MKNVEEMSETRLDGEAMKKSHRNRVPHTKKLSIWDILQTDAANRGEKSRRHPLSSSPLLSGKRQKTEKRAWASSKNRTARQQKTIEKAHKTILIPLHLRETHKKARTPFGLQPLTLSPPQFFYAKFTSTSMSKGPYIDESTNEVAPIYIFLQKNGFSLVL